MPSIGYGSTRYADGRKVTLAEFDKWTHGGGKVLSGLVKRRAAEKALFLGIVNNP